MIGEIRVNLIPESRIDLKEAILNIWPPTAPVYHSTYPMINTAGTQYEVYAATTADEIEKLRPFWLEVNKHPDADVDFYSLIVAARLEVLNPYVLVAAENGCPKAMLIGRLENQAVPIKAGYYALTTLNIRQLTFLQEGFLGVCSPEIARAMVLQVQKCLAEGRADRAVLENVDVTSILYSFAKTTPSIWLRDYSNETIQRWTTKLPVTMDEFLKRRSQKHRYWLRRIGRVFEKDHRGQVKYEVYQKKSEVEAFCAEAERVAQNTYQRGLGVGFINNAENRRRVELAAEKGWLRGYAVFVGGEPVAFWCGRLYKNIMYLDWTGYRPAFRKYELGTILFLKMVEDLCASGASEINYGTGAAFYKDRFGDLNRTEGLVSIYAPTAKGLATSVLKTIEVVTNRVAKSLARKMGIADKIKKRWRGRLAEAVEREEERGEGAVPKQE